MSTDVGRLGGPSAGLGAAAEFGGPARLEGPAGLEEAAGDLGGETGLSSTTGIEGASLRNAGSLDAVPSGTGGASPMMLGGSAFAGGGMKKVRVCGACLFLMSISQKL